jgi:hypothetical protein
MKYMTNARGFAALGILIVLLLIVVVGGGAYYVGINSNTQTPTTEVATTTPQPVIEEPRPTSNDPTATPAPTCVGRDAMKPYILSISPTSGPAGTKVTIKGCNLSGFEADLNATFVRSDGRVLLLYGGTSYRKTPSVAEEQSMTVTVATYCPAGTITGLYSGASQKCEKVEATPGTYTVYVETPSGRSNTLTFIVTAATDKPVSQAINASVTSGHSPLSVAFTLSATDSTAASGVYYTITFGDGGAGGFPREAAPSLTHVYNKPGIYTASVTRNTQCSSWECLGPSTTVGTVKVVVQ